MLHIIGVAHRAQSRKPNVDKSEVQRSFEQCLRRAIKDVNPTFIAEEDNQQFLDDRGEISIGREVGHDEYGIEHRFCEPNREERAEIGSKNLKEISLAVWMSEGVSGEELDIKARIVEIRDYFPLRERHWLKQLTGCRTEPSIFICGDVHLWSFSALLQKEGIPYKIVERGIGVDERDELYYRAQEFLKQSSKSEGI